MTDFIKHAYDMGVYQALSDLGLVKEAITQSPVGDQPTVGPTGQPQARRYRYPQLSIADSLTGWTKERAALHRNDEVAQAPAQAPSAAPSWAGAGAALAGRAKRFLGTSRMSDPSQGVRENTGTDLAPASSATPRRVINRLPTFSAPRAARPVAAPGNSFNTYSGLAQAYNKTRGDNARVSGQQLAGMYGNKMIHKNTTFDMSRLQTALATGKGPKPGLGALQGDVQNAGRGGSALPMFKRLAAPPPAAPVAAPVAAPAAPVAAPSSPRRGTTRA